MYRTVKLKGNRTMTEEQPKEETTFTQADIDKLNEEHAKALQDLEERLKNETERKVDGAIKRTKAEMEEQAKRSKMSETEKLTAELDEYKAKYQEQADINAIASQKDETRKLMAEMGVDSNCLDFVFVPKDIEATTEKVKAFKEYVDKVKKETFEGGVKSKIPQAKEGDDKPSVNGIYSAVQQYYDEKK